MSIEINNSSVKQIFKHQKKIPVEIFVLVSLFSLLCPFLYFIVLKLSNFILKKTFFDWLPNWFLLSDYLTNKNNYNSFLIKVSWWLLLLFSILIPIAEEIYFRGFLLRKTNEKVIISPNINTILFCVYHFWLLLVSACKVYCNISSLLFNLEKAKYLSRHFGVLFV